METKEELEAAFALREERLNLERESLAIERERLAAERAHAEANAQLQRVHHPFFNAISISFLALLCFACGIIAGLEIANHRRTRLHDERLRVALRQLGGDITFTNDLSHVNGKDKRDVSIVLFQ